MEVSLGLKVKSKVAKTYHSYPIHAKFNVDQLDAMRCLCILPIKM
ncbi:hypothetical protein PALB_24570 [Pseudoalteromonas luteoviolacea B = ATCC 29581]|nr:hypothetical protein PALB_24570 [Pseudoalteromonas luteoviolacea B = ATCC 29581]